MRFTNEKYEKQNSVKYFKIITPLIPFLNVKMKECMKREKRNV